ncbi:MAG: hypothetical protein KF890_07585 [Nitrospira sp.]|nr:hypothetical protein [Nitrospira sp.]
MTPNLTNSSNGRTIPPEQVQTLNYCAHAIDALHDLERNWQHVAPESAQVCRSLIDKLHQSVKFILPNGCQLIDPQEFRQTHLDQIRLPFPCVAFEAPWETEHPVQQPGEFTQWRATKRIALCWEAGPDHELLPGHNRILTTFPEGGVFVVPIYWSPEVQHWTVAFGGAFVPYHNTVITRTLEEATPSSRLAAEALITAGRATPTSMQFQAEPFVLLPEGYAEILEKHDGNREEVFAQIMLDSHDEIMMLIQACSVINCANVSMADIGAPAALNKKRREKGKQPFFSYKVLQLSDERRESRTGDGGSSHASPRMHLRRGHLRRLDSKVVWVRPSMVNPGSRTGVVWKDYALPPKE